MKTDNLLKVKDYLAKYNLDKNIITLESSSATVKLAAESLNVDEGRIAKSLSFKVDNKYIMIVTAGDKKIDNGKYKKEFSKKAQMIQFEEVENIIGHPVGGVCPFAVNDNVEIYLDISLKKYDSVFPACGSGNNAIELTIKQLEEVVDFLKWIDVCK